MVSTRHHPNEFASPSATPTASPSSSQLLTPSRPRRTTTRWSHTPSHLTLIWLTISLPLVLWDTGYVLLRPHSMPGGFLHAPLWSPYALYGTVDYIYGQPAWAARNGFTAAQAAMNLLETFGYMWYLAIVLRAGASETTPGRGAPSSDSAPKALAFLTQARTVRGRDAAVAVLLALCMTVMTLSKTVLYWLNEYYSGFANIGHNTFSRLLFLWIIPNGAWIVLPGYMLYVFSMEILEGLEAATGGDAKKRS